MKHRILRFLSLTFLLTQSLVLSGSTWTSTSSGVWSNGANWDMGVPNGAGAVALFNVNALPPDIILVTQNFASGITLGTLGGGLSNSTITIRLVNSITMDNNGGGATISGLVGSNLNILNPIILAEPLTVAGSGTELRLYNISGPFSVTYTNNDIHLLGFGNTYTGGSHVMGTVFLGASNVLPAAGGVLNEGTITWNADDGIQTTANYTSPGGSFDLNGFNQTLNTMTVANGVNNVGAGTLTLTDPTTPLTMGNATTLNGGTLIFTGGTNGGGTIRYNGGATVATINSNVDLGGIVRQFNIDNGGADPDMRITATVSTGGIMKTGMGTLDPLLSLPLWRDRLVTRVPPSWDQATVTLCWV